MYRGLLKNQNRASCCEGCRLCISACCFNTDRPAESPSAASRSGRGFSNHCNSRVRRPESGGLLRNNTEMQTSSNSHGVCGIASFSPRVHPRRTVISDTTEMTSFDSSLPLPPPALSSREMSSSQEYEDPPFDSGRRSVLNRQTTNSSHRSQQHLLLQTSSLQTSSPDSMCLPITVPMTASCGASPRLHHHQSLDTGVASSATLPHHHLHNHRSHPTSIEHHVSTSSSSCKSPHHHVMHSSSSLHRINRSLDTQESVEGTRSGLHHQYHHHLSEEVDSCEEEDLTVRDAAAAVASSGERTTTGTTKRRIDVRTVSSGRLDPSSTSSLHR